MKHRSRSALPAALCLFVLAAAAPAAPAPAPPDTPQGKRMAALLAAFDAGTPDAIRAFVEGNFAASAQKDVPLEQRVGRIGGMAKQIGPLAFDRLLKGDGPEISFLARGKKSGEWVEVGMRVETGPPYGILGLRFEQSEGPDAEKVEPLGSDAAVAAKAAETLRALAEKGSFSGVVLMARNGAPFFSEAYGSADRDFGVPNRRDTKFNIGSINKIFTQVAIAQLAAAGRLSLSDTIHRHLPDYRGQGADRITIQQLLTMTSGLGDIFGKKYDATPKSHLRTLADFLPLFETEPLLFEPGKDRRYSNAGYVILGLIVEKASGQGYHDYVREHVFEAAGMKDSDAWAQDAIVPNRAVGYTRESEGGAPTPPDAPLRVNIYALPAVSSSAGGGYSTAADLLAFDQAMRANRLLPPEWTDWFYSEKANPPKPDAAPRKLAGGFGVAGGTAGANALLECDLDTGVTIVVLSNLDPPSAESLGKKLRGWLGLK